MKCLNCGLIYDNEYAYCPNCGAAAPIAEPVSLNPVADKVSFALRDKLFLTIAILFSASVAFAIFCGSIPTFQILITIFLWITYSKAIKYEDTSGSIRNISGTVYAYYIIEYILSGLLIFAGVLLTIFSIGIVSSGTPNMSAIMDEAISELDPSLFAQFSGMENMTSDVLEIFLIIIGPISLISGALILVFNILGMRKIHKFIKSIHLCMNFQAPFFENPRSARGWMIFFTVLSGASVLSSIGSLFAFLTAGCQFVAMILATVLISKYFVEPTYNF